MRNIEYINRNWRYKDEFRAEFINPEYDYSDFENIELPHTNIELPYNYFDEEIYQFTSCYVKEIYIDEDSKDKKLFLDFEGVMIYAKVYCNGKFVCEHKGGYTFFEADITDYVDFGSTNIIVVEVDSTERKDIPPFGNVVDYLTYGGIYREVSLRIVENTYIKNIYLKTNDCLDDIKSLNVEAILNVAQDGEYEINISLIDEGKEIATNKYIEKISSGVCNIDIGIKNLEDIQLWDIDNPKLYSVRVCISKDGYLIDELVDRTGFRHCEFRTDGFYLNNKQVKIIGLNRHQAYPYVGYAMPKRIQEKDADILKYEMGVNLVRCSHYPQSKHFLNRCDEIGLLVFEEIPGWQHIGDKKWQDIAVKNVNEMITRDFNHPSIIIWGVRINESNDNHEFYTRTNKEAHALDDTRQTGGVRYIQNSELLEDVYTFNDFVHCGKEEVLRERSEVTGLDYDVPLLVTESNGHMYPTKRFDQEAKLVEHATRHLRVINETNKREDMVGSISWCAFDYNTHSCFGSGDKICYHGVSDMFRIPKYAAYSYSSQIDPKKQIVLEPISVASRGERDGGGIVPINILTNCDYIKVYKNNQFVDCFYPNREEYEGLYHPPITITHLLPQSTDLGIDGEDGKQLKEFIVEKIKSETLINMSQEDGQYLYNIAQKYNKNIHELMGTVIKGAGGWGDNANTILIEGYINDEKVVSKTIGEIKYAKELVLNPDSYVLHASETTFDATRVVVKLVDTLGNITPFTNEAVDIEIEGEAKIMGPSKFSLQGGCSAFWVRTLGKTGNIKIKARSAYFEKEIELNIIS